MDEEFDFVNWVYQEDTEELQELIGVKTKIHDPWYHGTQSFEPPCLAPQSQEIDTLLEDIELFA